MFEVGEVVFASMRGSGVVKAIETRTMLDEAKEYVIIQMKFPHLLMMVPTERIDHSGFRKISNEEVACKVESILSKKEVEVDYTIDIKKRTKLHREKLSTGSFIACSEVVRDLMCMEKIKTLKNAERSILMQAKQLLLDELSIIKKISVEEAQDRIEMLLE